MRSTMVKADQFYPPIASPSVDWRTIVSLKLPPISSSSIKEWAMLQI
jgi:hypothetical protein